MDRNDLINRSELKKALHNFFDGKVIDEPTYILRDVFCYIDNAPTVYHPNCDNCEDKAKQYSLGFQDGYLTGKERPHGEWKVNNYGDVYCSNCKIMALCKEFTADDFREVKTDYCAFCGAKMKGGDN